MTGADQLTSALPATANADCRAGEAAGCGGKSFAAVAETHSAVVFFAGDRAYKLKKPVDLDFLDFTSQRARSVACRRETELNRRFAPDVYLGVAEIRDLDGRVCDQLVVMRRMPAGRRLAALVKARAPVGGVLRQVARVLAAWHAAAPRSPQIAAQGGQDALTARWQANIAKARASCGHLLQDAGLDEIERLAGRFTAGRAPLFAERIRAGRVVDGHGDLLADDIFCLDDGVRVLDCLEFDDRLRWLDGLDDASFLAMDLERLGAPDLARRFTSWYAEYSGDPAPAPLRHHYVAYRAFVRAKVACLRARAGDGQAAAEAWQLAGMTLRHLRAGAVTLVLVGGLPGTAKSTLAGALADRLGCTVLSSDRIRKELAGVPAERRCAAPWGAGIYTAAWTERVYAELLGRAGRLLALGESVIADASFTSPAQRDAAAQAAAATHADLVQLRCTAPAEVARQRLTARTGGISDADADIARQMAAVEAPWPEAVTIDTSQLGPGTAPWCPQSRPARRCSRPWRQSGQTGQNMCGARSGPCCSPTEHLREARFSGSGHTERLHGASDTGIVPATPAPPTRSIAQVAGSIGQVRDQQRQRASHPWSQIVPGCAVSREPATVQVAGPRSGHRVAAAGQVADEPVAGQRGRGGEGAWLLEQVSRAGHDGQVVLTPQPGLGPAVEVEHHLVIAADDE